MPVSVPDRPSHRSASAGLAEDAKEVRAAIRRSRSPVVVVGWSYGGRVIGSAAVGESSVIRLIVRSPQTNGVIERFFETLKYEHLYRAPIDDGDALAMEVARFRQIYNTIRPHQALGDQTPRHAYLHAEVTNRRHTHEQPEIRTSTPSQTLPNS
jgi:putative transposase